MNSFLYEKAQEKGNRRGDPFVRSNIYNYLFNSNGFSREGGDVDKKGTYEYMEEATKKYLYMGYKIKNIKKRGVDKSYSIYPRFDGDEKGYARNRNR